MVMMVLSIPEKGEKWKCTHCAKAYRSVNKLRTHLQVIHAIKETQLER